MITRAEADLDVMMVRIYGRNFLPRRGALPDVTLARMPLVVQTVEDRYIEAWLPADIAPGSYLLTVSRPVTERYPERFVFRHDRRGGSAGRDGSSRSPG